MMIMNMMAMILIIGDNISNIKVNHIMTVIRENKSMSCLLIMPAIIPT